MDIKLFYIFILLNFSLFGQKTTFYKNVSFSKEVSEKKAKYKKVKFTENDTVITHSIRILDNVLLKETKKLHGKPFGIWKTYDSSGVIKSLRDYNELVYSKKPIRFNWMTDGKDEDYKNFKHAVFPNGKQGLQKFLKEKIQYPEELSFSAKTHIRFIIDKDGNAEPHSILKEFDKHLDIAAWQLIKKMPKWKPATKNNIPVVSFLLLPINYTPEY